MQTLLLRTYLTAAACLAAAAPSALAQNPPPQLPIRTADTQSVQELAAPQLPAVEALPAATRVDPSTPRSLHPSAPQAQSAPGAPFSSSQNPEAPLPQVSNKAEIEVMQRSELDARLAKPGSFVWQPERASDGAMLIVVSLPEQRAHVYRDGVRIGAATISSGSKGRETPTGNFEILQKKRMHHSNLYDDAPMPFMQRLTWDGVALHAGRVPGYPASHGCIRLPETFAQTLYQATSLGTLVVVADDASDSTAQLTHPGDDAPLDAATGLPRGAYAQALIQLSHDFAAKQAANASTAIGSQADASVPNWLVPVGEEAPVSVNHHVVRAPVFSAPIWGNGTDPGKALPVPVPPYASPKPSTARLVTRQQEPRIAPAQGLDIPGLVPQPVPRSELATEETSSPQP